jgi:hypothetical protein
MFQVFALAAFTISLLLTLFGCRPFFCTLFVGIGMTANLTVIMSRYYAAWPMMPMYLGIIGLSVALSIIWLSSFATLNKEKATPQHLESCCLLGVILFIVLTTIFFPKDFYLPFLRSNVVWSHIFLVSGVIAKSFLIHAGVKAFGAIYKQKIQTSIQVKLTSTSNWVVYGYSLLTLSLFSGELWCYLGWGTPVVWHDAALTTVLSLWLYWTCFLHLLFNSSWNQKKRSRFVVAGAVLVLIFACHPDMGPFRLPFQV